MKTATPAAQHALCTRYFTEHLPQFLGQCLIEEVRELSCRFAIQIRGAKGSQWRLTLQDGRLVEVEETTSGAACRFLCDCGAFLRVVSGETPAQEAFFKGEVDLKEDIELGLRLSMLLAPFFEQFPFRA